MDFVEVPRGGTPIAVETKWKADPKDVGNLCVFHHYYPDASTIVLASDIDREFSRKVNNASVEFMGLDSFFRLLC